MVIAADRVLPGGDGEPTLDDAAVVVTDDRITAVRPRRDLDPAVEVHRFPGCTVLPGLINAHVHLCFAPGRNPADDVPARSEAELATRMTEHAAVLLAHGVTTARDLGDRDGLAVAVRDRIRSGDVPGPRLLVSGPPVTPVGGHCWFLGGAVDGPGDVERHIARLAGLGVDWVKVMVSGGHVTAGGAAIHESQFTAAELDHLVAVAAGHGLPVAAHAHGLEAVRRAVDAGVHTVEHCSLLDATGTALEFDDDLARRMSARGTVACTADSHDRERLTGIVGAAVAADLLRRGRWLLDHDVALVAGTDAGVTRFEDVTACLGRHGEQLRPAEVIAMATTDAATALGLGAETGTLRPGAAADLLVVEGDPLDDLSALRRPRLVVARGRAFRPQPDGGLEPVAR